MSSQDNLPTHCRVYNQYTGTNLETFIKKLCQSLRDSTAPYHNYFMQSNNLSIAEGDALDLFGEFLNFNRYITFNDPLDIVRPNTEGIDEYLVITQRDNDILKQCRLGDKAYRTILRLLMESRNTMSSVVTLSRIISNIVEADVFVGDNMNMAYITYYFLDRIPGWLEVTMHNYDILPRPAGMSAEYISAFSRFFGFLIGDPPDREATARVFSGFWKARFPDIAPKQVILPYSQLLQTNYTPAPLSQQEYTQLLHNYTVSRTAEEVRIRDANRATRELEAQSRDHDHKYMYIPKSHAGIVFPAYTEFLEKDNQDDRTSFSWQAKKKALTAFIQSTELMRAQALTKEVYRAKKDPRHNLYFDQKTGFYFYSPPGDNGTFNPYTLANLYQDACGLWFPQDDLITQLRKGYVSLRRDDFASSHVTKTLDTSPLLDKLRPFWLQNGHSIDADPQDHQKFVELASNFHTASKYFAKVYPVHLSSFRAALDMEYDAASMMKFAETLYSKVISRPGSRSQQEVDYYRDIYRRIMEYYGSSSGSYYYFYRDYDKNAPVYARRTFIKTQRYLVMETINRLTDLYARNVKLYSELAKYTTPSLEQEVYTVINSLKTLLQTNPWNDIEVARNGQGYTEAYSAKNLRNDQVDYYLNEFYRGKRGNAEWLEFSRKCRDSCERLMNDCGKGGDPISKSRWGDRYDSWRCYVNPEYDFIPKFEEPSRNNWDTYGSYYTAKESGGTPRGCNLHGYRSFRDGFYGHGSRVTALENELLRRNREIKQLEHEKANRTEVTKDRTLEEVMRYYNSYIPPSQVPPPPDPHYDITIDYPDYLETDYGAFLYRTEQEDLERQRLLRLEQEREARGLEFIQTQPALQAGQDALLGLPPTTEFDHYTPPPYTKVELLELEIGKHKYDEPKLQDYIDEANRQKEAYANFPELLVGEMSPEWKHEQEHRVWQLELDGLLKRLEKAKQEEAKNPPTS